MASSSSSGSGSSSSSSSSSSSTSSSTVLLLLAAVAAAAPATATATTTTTTTTTTRHWADRLPTVCVALASFYSLFTGDWGFRQVPEITSELTVAFRLCVVHIISG